ncbi:MAG: rubrerythrin family protein [bacterium]|nr:rubrerythrin family protein [bacterium]
MSTIDDLKEAFADESQASVRYLTFARKAREEGREDVAEIFENAAMDELGHAQRDLELIQGVSKTEDNLQSAIYGEAAEYINKYPDFIEKALEENNIDAVNAFKEAADNQQLHSERFMETLSSINKQS